MARKWLRGGIDDKAFTLSGWAMEMLCDAVWKSALKRVIAHIESEERKIVSNGSYAKGQKVVLRNLRVEIGRWIEANASATTPQEEATLKNAASAEEK